MCEESVDEVIAGLLDEIKNDDKSWADTVQVGDWVDSPFDGHYTFSGHQYKTKGKLYQVRVVDVRDHGTSVIVDGDYFDPAMNGEPEKVWLGSSKVIVRAGKVIWESSLEKAIKAIPPAELEEGNRQRHPGSEPLAAWVSPEVLPM